MAQNDMQFLPVMQRATMPAVCLGNTEECSLVNLVNIISFLGTTGSNNGRVSDRIPAPW